ncbi:MAG: alpha/beta hydrolase [Candidatus Caccosoma sp.]|nr:alpha/beta hydrolase [Candidatus Caccosoma sp.]
MINEKINLKEFYPMLENDAYLTSYCPSNFAEFSTNKVRKCIIVIPGGGYESVSDREGEPVALRFAGNDIAAFLLKYSIAPNLNYPNPFVEAFAAIAYVRKNASKYHIDPNKISVIGFSAGGHLAATISAYWNAKEYASFLKVSNEDIKVNGCILGYPVISTTFGHKGTIVNSTKNDPILLEKLSIDKHVSKDFPKTFIWHTTFDTVVDVKNSLALAEALSENKIFYEMHIYPMLDHGQSLADYSVYTEQMMSKENMEKMKYNTQWIDNAIHFIKEYI